MLEATFYAANFCHKMKILRPKFEFFTKNNSVSHGIINKLFFKWGWASQVPTFLKLKLYSNEKLNQYYHKYHKHSKHLFKTENKYFVIFLFTQVEHEILMPILGYENVAV